MSEEERGQATEELTSGQKRANVIRLAFGGSEDLLDFRKLPHRLCARSCG